MTTARVPLSGWPITILRKAGETSVHHLGVLTTVLPHAVVLDDAQGLGTWAVGESVVASAGETGVRLSSPLEIAAVRGTRVVLLLRGQWQPCDVPTSGGHAIALKVEVLVPGVRAAIEADTITIWPGGMSIATSTPIAASTVEVRMRWRHFGAHFPCDVVVAEGGGASSAVVQLRFQALSGPQGAFMRELLGELDAA